MKSRNFLSGCSQCGLDRRQFLAGCAKCVGAVGLLGGAEWLGAAEAGEKVRIRVIYALHDVVQPGPDWPNVGYNFGPVMERINQELAKGCPGFEFVSSMANGAEQAQKIAEEDKAGAIDGYLVYQMNCWNPVVQTMVGTDKPVLYADYQYAGSGGFLVYSAGLMRGQTANFGFVASSNMKDVVEAVKCFSLVKKGGTVSDFAAAVRAVRIAGTAKTGGLGGRPDPVKCLTPAEWQEKIKATKILAIRDQNAGPAEAMMGIPVENVSFAELNEAWGKADQEQVKAIVDGWEKTAAKIDGVPRKTLEESAAMYLAEKAVLQKHQANAITINCLGGFYGGHIHAYPCLGFYELNNEGLVGGCECDVPSAATMVAFTTLTQGRPGYISDPVIDTAKRQIIYAHCVSHNRPFGPQGQSNPYEILTHSEDRQGAAVRSILPVGYMTTTLEIAPGRKEILFHQGKAVANDPDDRACRTKLAAEPVGDIEKLFTMWDQWGWHRVTFYGDLKEPVFALADAIGWKVVEEA